MENIMRQMAKKTVCTLMVLALCPISSFAEIVKIPAGTAILLRSTADVNSDNTLGDVVTFTVVSDVVVNGKVVAKAGSSATGEVSAISKRKFFGIPAKVSVTVQRVTMADSSIVVVNKTKTVEGDDQMVCSIIGTILCLFPALIKGGDAKIASGATFDAMVAAPSEVNVP